VTLSLKQAEYAQVFNQNKTGRDFVTGDIHGNKKAFLKALESVCFDKSKDRLFCTGDLVDGGSDNLFILSQLEEEWFMAIRGNHEQMLLNCVETGRVRERLKAIETYIYNGGGWWHELDEEHKDAIYQQLAKLPYSITNKTAKGNIGLVHGEVPKRCENWGVLTKRLQGFFDSAYLEVPEIVEARFQAVWGRSAITDGFDYFRGKYIHKDYQIKRSVKGIDATVHGHTGVYEPVVWGNQVWIDTCGKTGGLTILQPEDLLRLVEQSNG
jgi:serine/threonine protein phosphatase 1